MDTSFLLSPPFLLSDFLRVRYPSSPLPNFPHSSEHQPPLLPSLPFINFKIKIFLLIRFLTLKFSGSLINFAGLEGLLSSLTSWSQHSDLELQPHLLSVSYMLVCFHSQSCRTFLNRHLMHHCWHHHLSTSRKTHIFFAQASSIVQKDPTLILIFKEIIHIHLSAGTPTLSIISTSPALTNDSNCPAVQSKIIKTF